MDVHVVEEMVMEKEENLVDWVIRTNPEWRSEKDFHLLDIDRKPTCGEVSQCNSCQTSCRWTPLSTKQPPLKTPCSKVLMITNRWKEQNDNATPGVKANRGMYKGLVSAVRALLDTSDQVQAGVALEILTFKASAKRLKFSVKDIFANEPYTWWRRTSLAVFDSLGLFQPKFSGV